VRLLSGHFSAHYAELWYGSPRQVVLVPTLCLALLLTAARWLTRRQELRAPDSFFLWLCVGGASASALNYSTQWAHSNCYMPIAVFASLYSAMVLGELLQLRLAKSAAGTTAALSCACAVLIQFGALIYDPRAQVPSAADRAALRVLFARLAKLPGPVLMPAHPLYGYLRDGTICAHSMGFRDVAQAGGVPGVEQRIASGEFGTVVIDTSGRYPASLKRHYTRVDSFEFEGRTLYPLTGYLVRPKDAFVRRASVPAP
jgi:hypothetical protein